MKRTITCTNTSSNTSLILGDEFSPFVLNDVEGIYTVDVNVNSIENSMIDGSFVAGSVIRARNIVLTITDKERYGDNRNLLYTLFMPRTEGVLVYEETDGDFNEKRMISYVVEKIEPGGIGEARTHVISLLCPDPFFTDLNDTYVQMSGWESAFEFEHEFLSGGEELGSRVFNKLVNVVNDSSVDNLGFTVIFTAEGTVQNPGLYQAETGNQIQVGTSSLPLRMVSGDQLVISTVTGNKNAYLISNGIQTGVNRYIDESSEYIQLKIGNNTLRYFADSGEDNLSVSISFRYRYQGV